MGKRRGAGRRVESDSSSEYEPSEEPKEGGEYKLSESKNVPKIFGKSILNFAERQRLFVGEVLAAFGRDPAAFS
jgi:hypothetical protein